MISGTDIGSTSEDFVQAVAERAFSPDFVFRSPHKPNGKEVTDVLVLFDDFALVIQAKAQRLGPTGTGYTDNSLDWVRKNLEKASRQVSGALRTIREGRLMFVENKRLGRVPFNSADHPFLYGVILLDHESEPYDPIDLAPSLSGIPAPTHVLSHRDLFMAAKLLNTPSDLINYLEARTDVLLPTLKPIKVHEESRAMGYYLSHLEEIICLCSQVHGVPVMEVKCRKYAEDLRMLAAEAHPDKRCGVIIDHMIDRLHELGSQGESSPEISPHVATKVYTRVAIELGNLPRSKRLEYGKRYLSVLIKAAQTRKPNWVRIYNKRRSLCIILYASPLSKTDRVRRSEELAAITSLAKAYHEVRTAIGVATEAGNEMGSSYDFALKESPPMPDPKAQELGREVFGQRHVC